jgi:cytochrome b
MTLTASIKVWDPLVRTFHWSLVAFFLLAYLLEGTRPALHSHAGYVVALLIGFRLLWGLIGPTTARFTDFVRSPRVVMLDLLGMLQRTRQDYLGHDPLGGVMICALLITLLVTAVSGMMLFALEGSGPLAAFDSIASLPGSVLAAIHAWAADGVMVLAVLHVSGVLLTSYQQRRNLILAMITGRKSAPVDTDR